MADQLRHVREELKMGRRHLCTYKVEAALQRRKQVECLVGPIVSGGRRGICHFSISCRDADIVLSLFETADIGTTDFLDLGEFGPLNPLTEFGDADETLRFNTLESCLSHLEERWPECTARLVNEGVVQDEYRELLLSQGR